MHLEMLQTDRRPQAIEHSVNTKREPGQLLGCEPSAPPTLKPRLWVSGLGVWGSRGVMVGWLPCWYRVYREGAKRMKEDK